MPFLNKDILLAILNTYDNAEQEEKKKSPNSVTHQVGSAIVGGFNSAKSSVGYNTAGQSKDFCNQLRDLIIEATERNNLEAWGDLILAAGDSAFTTQTSSPSWISILSSFLDLGSKYTRAALALRAYILNKVDKECKSIQKDRPKTADQFLAEQIRKIIDRKIFEEKDWIDNANKNIQTNKAEKANTLTINNLKKYVKNYENSSEDLIQLRQRHLCYLNAYQLLQTSQLVTQIKPIEKLIQELFKTKYFEYYNTASWEFSKETLSKIAPELPLYLQPNYDSIYFRRRDLSIDKDKTDEDVIISFEAKVLLDLKAKQNFEQSRKELGNTPIVESLPQKTFIPELISLDNIEGKSNSTQFSILSDQKESKQIILDQNNEISPKSSRTSYRDIVSLGLLQPNKSQEKTANPLNAEEADNEFRTKKGKGSRTAVREIVPNIEQKEHTNKSRRR